MTTWSIAPSGRWLLHGGEPTFLLADTVWAAFGGPTENEWLDHLELRRRQGFNALLISVLPIEHDRSTGTRSPYALREGAVDFGAGDPDYWTEAERLLEQARERGFTPMLVLLWNNFVPGTWGSRLTPEHVLSADQTETYVRETVARFRRFDPIWIVSGDDDLDDDVALERYSSVAALLREVAPGQLVTWHDTPTARMPQPLADSELVDFHSLQSGHNEAWETLPADLTHYYRALDVARPIINLEPCYEGLGRFRGAARHSAADVRRASWTGVVSGAAAGLGYGAHGVWSWHRRGEGFSAEDVHGAPFPFSVAAAFPGADDVAYLRRVVDAERLWGLDAAPDLLVAEPSGVVTGRAPDGTIAVYAPTPFALTLVLGDVEAAGMEVTVHDLAARRPDAARWTAVDGGIRLEQPEFTGDALFVLRPAHSGGER
ncbi:DUF4038 domain-containing protein [Microbacterium sp. SMR1]|uniref:apiosidase-like domain-containing protein n=1 Tax=Microbacterium sp. SMR1 TaxID=1497340 RepID=UPI000DCF26C9|nr:DUF4038 domain-containing protein [Microbacterium sp. SMR1]RAZ32895.1 hypothetical protein DO944_06755 [Microbacterium sp. SMR1]